MTASPATMICQKRCCRAALLGATSGVVRKGRSRGSLSGWVTRTGAGDALSRMESPWRADSLAGFKASTFRRQKARPCGVSSTALSQSQAASESGLRRTARVRSRRALLLSPALAAAMPWARRDRRWGMAHFLADRVLLATGPKGKSAPAPATTTTAALAIHVFSGRIPHVSGRITCSA